MPDLRANIHPTLLERVDKALAAMALVGHPMRICQGIRTAIQQHELWRQGRDLPGRRVTSCDGYLRKSNHQVHADGLGQAVDCCFVEGEPFGEKQPWLLYGMLGETLGLVWGGRWKEPHDRPHLELKEG